MKLTQFNIKCDKNLEVKGEYEGNEKSGKVVIFSHGFGVGRDSRGMFTEISDDIKSEYLVVRFDYSKFHKDKNSNTVPSYSIQAKLLEKVISFITEKFNPDKVDIIAHSSGCFVIGILSPENIEKTILLAPPPVAPYQEMIEYFSKRQGTIIDEKGISKIERSDGSLTLISDDYWKDAKQINPLQLYKNLSLKTKLYFIKAAQDQVLTEKDYSNIKSIKSIEFVSIDGNHEFEGNSRKILIEKITSILSV